MRAHKVDSYNIHTHQVFLLLVTHAVISLPGPLLFQRLPCDREKHALEHSFG
jgi:hypothetical protein